MILNDFLCGFLCRFVCGHGMCGIVGVMFTNRFVCGYGMCEIVGVMFVHLLVDMVCVILRVLCLGSWYV